MSILFGIDATILLLGVAIAVISCIAAVFVVRKIWSGAKGHPHKISLDPSRTPLRVQENPGKRPGRLSSIRIRSLHPLPGQRRSTVSREVRISGRVLRLLRKNTHWTKLPLPLPMACCSHLLKKHLPLMRLHDTPGCMRKMCSPVPRGHAVWP